MSSCQRSLEHWAEAQGQVELGGTFLFKAKGTACVKAGRQERAQCLGGVQWCLAWLEQRVWGGAWPGRSIQVKATAGT